MHAAVFSNKQGILDECARRTPTVTHLPFYYHVHLNVPCNQRCIMCIPTGEHRREALPLEQFVAFFEQIQPYAEHLTLIGGEPLMYPWISEVLDLLARHEIAVTINTNATLLTPRIIDRLLALHELNLKCSIDAATRTTYHRIRGSDLFERVTANMGTFAERVRDRPNLRLIPIYVVMRENLGEVLPFVDLVESMRPSRVEFHPVRHVTEWHVTNDTDWVFDGREQSCEFFADDYNAVMRQAAATCAAKGMRCETLAL